MAQFTPEWQANFPLTDPSRLLVKVGPVYSGITGPVWSGMGGPICSGIAIRAMDIAPGAPLGAAG